MNGKGSKPRNLSAKFRENYGDIDWGRKYWYICEFGRPVGLDPIPHLMTVKQARGWQKEINENCPTGGQLHLFATEQEANEFVKDVKLDSEEWKRYLAPDIVIMNPDGWNRSDFDNSWKEKITKQEFCYRLLKSTVSCNPGKLMDKIIDIAYPTVHKPI